jgi:phosphoribosylaminoimidazole-succinocarboxamide synthase
MERLAGVVPNHLIATEVDEYPAELRRHAAALAGRSALVRKAAVVPFECVARGYLAGSAFKEYKGSGTACGLALPPGLERASPLPKPIFTPATKAESGHDENVSFETMAAAVGAEVARGLRDLTLTLYTAGAEHARSAGLILADTKFEFGRIDGELVLIDEALTPDSSRYWEASAWRPGIEPASFDKQFVRNWLDASGWDHESPPPELPADVVAGTRERYVEAFRRLTGGAPAL